MADIKLSEVIGDKPSFIDTDEFNSNHRGVKMKQTDGNAQRPKPPQSTTSESVGSFHVDIDVSDALKGLKAVQREARKATAALKELEAQQDKMAYLPIRPEVSE